METVLDILIIEDDINVCKSFENYAATMDKIRVVATTGDAEVAIELVKQYLPEAIILDLELDEGRGNGIKFLDDLKSIELTYKPFIVITTNNSSEMTKEIVRTKGIDFYFSKHQSDYCEQGILFFLESMKEQIHKISKKVDSIYIVEDSEKKKEKFIKALIEKDISDVGINPKMLGRNYLIEAIYLIVKEEKRPVKMILADKYRKSQASIDKAMQLAIDRAWQVNKEDVFNYYKAIVNPDRGAPTVTEFIYYYANIIKSNL